MVIVARVNTQVASRHRVTAGRLVPSSPKGKPVKTMEVQLYKLSALPEGIKLVVDPSVIIAVVLGEPSRDALLAGAWGEDLIAPPSLEWEVGNALSAAYRQGRLTSTQVERAAKAYRAIPVRFAGIELERALQLAVSHGIYAYDGYVIECARRYRAPLLTLDAQQARIAALVGVTVIEV